MNFRSWILFLIFILTSLFSQNFQVLFYQFALSPSSILSPVVSFISLQHRWHFSLFFLFSLSLSFRPTPSLSLVYFPPSLSLPLNLFSLPTLFTNPLFLFLALIVSLFRSAVFSSTFWFLLIPKKRKLHQKSLSLSRYVYASLSQMIVFVRFFFSFDFLSEAFDLMDVIDLER